MRLESEREVYLGGWVAGGDEVLELSVDGKVVARVTVEALRELLEVDDVPGVV
ncbi:MAG: hypothetical protein IPH08_04035 [Rhodocyclaceae bacterium]|nr:hypothetical protein [Rhodocyclaceae bacterium]MBK6906302.1 hypothetical protein [Rhodocyclaceae bacterium]